MISICSYMSYLIFYSHFKYFSCILWNFLIRKFRRILYLISDSDSSRPLRLISFCVTMAILFLLNNQEHIRKVFYFMTPSESSKSAFHICATTSLLCGILGIFSFFYPPIQLIFGSSALILAYVSKNSGSLHGSAIAGIILGVLCIISSFVIFKEYIWIMDLLDDPASSAEIKEMIQTYRDLIEQALPLPTT